LAHKKYTRLTTTARRKKRYKRKEKGIQNQHLKREKRKS
jgi:hypothetical protein